MTGWNIHQFARTGVKKSCDYQTCTVDPYFKFRSEQRRTSTGKLFYYSLFPFKIAKFSNNSRMFQTRSEQIVRKVLVNMKSMEGEYE